MSIGFYGRLVAGLRMIDRRRWKYRGEKMLNLGPGELTLINDSALPEEDLRLIEYLVSKAMRDKAASLRAQADAIERAATDFDAKSERRRFNVRQAARRVYEDETEALVMELYHWTFRHTDTEAA